MRVVHGGRGLVAVTHGGTLVVVGSGADRAVDLTIGSPIVDARFSWCGESMHRLRRWSCVCVCVLVEGGWEGAHEHGLHGPNGPNCLHTAAISPSTLPPPPPPLSLTCTCR